MQQNNKYLIIITGPTGIGKTAAAIEVAKALRTEIISCDSRQLYREMSIGTAVPSQEELAAVKHHLIHNLSVNDYYNASMFEQDVLKISEKLFQDHDAVIMTGGTGFYIDAVLNGIDELPDADIELRQSLTDEYKAKGIGFLQEKLRSLDPVYYEKVDLNNPNRLLKAIEITLITGKPYSSQLTRPKRRRNFRAVLIGLEMEREKLYERIDMRVDMMLERGLLDEAKALYPYRENNALNTVGYKELYDYFDGNIDFEEAVRLIKRNSRRYARRQMTWFRRYKDMQHFSPDNIDKIMQTLKNTMHGK